MHKRAFTLMEILVASIIMVLVMTGMANVFVAAKKHILHSRSRIQAVELARLFLSPLQMDVRQDQWGSNCLSASVGCPGAQTIDGIVYTPTYQNVVAFGGLSLRKAKVTVTWNEP